MTTPRKKHPADETDPTEWPAAEHARFMPPWRDSLPDGELSPPYGPQSPGAFTAARQHHDESIHAGGLWDHDRENPRRAPAQTQAKLERVDGADVLEYLRTHKDAMPERQFAAAWRFFHGESYGRIARDMDVQPQTVKTWVWRVRQEMKGGGE